MRRIVAFPAAMLFSLMLLLVVPARGAEEAWRAEGMLLEACTCSVPCPCNFGEPPSPQPYCHAVYAYRLTRAAWGGTDLSGLVFGGADGAGAPVGYLDSRATGKQKDALRKLAEAVFAKGGPSEGPRTWTSARITHEVSGGELKLDIERRGGFTARVITGGDGKTPVTVENNTVWPIRRAVKAKTRSLRYSDGHGNAIQASGTNANYGNFAFTGTIAMATRPARTSSSCCAGKRHP